MAGNAGCKHPDCSRAVNVPALPCPAPPPLSQSCAVDPGAVRTEVWRHTSRLVQAAVNRVYAPPDGRSCACSQLGTLLALLGAPRLAPGPAPLRVPLGRRTHDARLS